MASVTANSRMIYAFSRDGGLPGHRRWAMINPRTRTPTNSIWLGVALSAIIGTLSLIQTDLSYPVAFFALTGICVVGLYISYIIPVFLRRRNPDFEPGPWNLGSCVPLIGWAAVAWVVLVGVVFCAPVFYPGRRGRRSTSPGPS